ncbi:hypothetical protein H2200_005408 [Cladophialophora chaetospira]|uniref:MFS transporter n=1 Tax=Cladophialophora chaetospira TaxID=386627 RepID=A0AA38XCI9_9EURO|nr:hypothetical protein H2200_005408 [Cladophialophora chaetospira]
MDAKAFHDEVEEVQATPSRGDLARVETMGTVRLSEGQIVYIPTPTADPQGKCPWVQISTLGLSLVSGFGGLLGFYIPEYVAVGKGYADITHLMTYPTLFMGIGNLIGMPIAVAVGRRVVMLASTALLIMSAILCATAKSYEWHLAARMVLGLAAGQSESIVPLIVQEIYFLHERSQALMIQQTIQVILCAIWVLFASPIAGAITPQWWYGLGGALAGLQFIVSIFLLPETKYERPLSSFQESSATSSSEDLEATSTDNGKGPILCTQRPALDFDKYAPRTWRSDMRLWVGTPEWSKALIILKQTFTVLLFPNVFWAMCLNGLTLGVNIAIGTTYGGIVTGAPYNWPDRSASYVNIGQIVTALVALPLLGYGSDALIKWMAKRNNGIHEPENRIIPLVAPIIVGIFTAVLYGQAATHPEQYHWFVYVWGIGGYFFTFVGANIVAITYLLDSYPARSGPILIVICAFRGIISFGVSYGIAPFIDTAGYDGAFGAFGGLTAAFGLLAIPIFIWGKKIRAFTGRFAKDKHTV